MLNHGSVDILILFYNKVDQTILCIDSFLTSGQYIYVLNNNSEPTQVEKLKRKYSKNNQVIILDSIENLGVSGGRNLLLRESKSPWFFSVDNDIVVSTQDWLEKMNLFLEKNPEAKILLPKIFNVHEQEYASDLKLMITEGKLEIISQKMSTTNYFPGGASIVHRSIIDRYGYFDEKMFVGFEDYEYAIRAMLQVKSSLEAHKLSSVELIHDHKFQNLDSDKEAVRVRYNEEKLNQSFVYLREKYDIELSHEWKGWTRTQVQLMTKKNWRRKIKRKLKSFFS